MFRKLLILIVYLIILGGCSRVLDVPTDQGNTAVDFEVYHNIIIVEAYVNDKWSKFIVDTGASISLLDFTQSKKYNFTYFIDVDNRLMGFGGRSRLMRTSEVSFAIKGASWDRSFSFSASDLSGLNSILSQSQQRVLGILGNDFLESHGAIIDYQKKKLLMARLD
ncbi:aspartyl protease family protein [Ekhidna sp. To15]|uniref:aspartyl protease family protein n=1 Tax=Ekhidna sp. To15 TaxID=3395267 RepID=UPI003F51EF61